MTKVRDNEKANKVGRPTKYDPAKNEQVTKLCLLGLTDVELSAFLEIDEKTLNVWKTKHPEFHQSIVDGREIADAEVAEKMYHRAKGYDKDGKHYPSETQAASLWLRNRQPKKWRDKQEVEHTGKLEVGMDDESMRNHARRIAYLLNRASRTK